MPLKPATVARIVPARAFGFLRDAASGREFFFHKSHCEPSRDAFDSLNPGDAVQYELDPAEKKQPRASRVVVPGF